MTSGLLATFLKLMQMSVISILAPVWTGEQRRFITFVKYVIFLVVTTIFQRQMPLILISALSSVIKLLITLPTPWIGWADTCKPSYKKRTIAFMQPAGLRI